MTYISQKNKLSVNNSSNVALNASASFVGIAEEVINYESVVLACKTDQAGVLYIDFSPDGTNWDSTLSFIVAANVNEVHRITVTRRYCRARFTNTSVGNQTYFRLQTTFGNYKTLTSSINSNIQDDADGLITRSIIIGQTNGGIFKNVPVSNEGHIEVEIHNPRLPFGAVHAESLMPVFQNDSVYGLNDGQVNYSSTLTGSVTGSDSLFSVKTGPTIYSFAQLQSRKRLRYRPGQGLVGRFAGYFDQGVPNCYLIAGFGHAEDGVYFGFKNGEFGILYINRGAREMRTLSITTASTTNQNVTVTLDGVAYSVPVTNSGSTTRTAWEISLGSFGPWKAYQIDSTVRFLHDSAGDRVGAFSLSATTAQGTFSETKSGATGTEIFIPQNQWNGDRLDGSADHNPSGYVIDPTKGNIYQIGIQYLGFGAITFGVEVVSPDGNNPYFVTVHTLKLPNTLTQTSFGNPSYPFTMAAYSAGSTVDKGVYVGSFAGFIEGKKVLHGNRFTYSNTITNASNALNTYYALFSIRNLAFYKGRTNQSVINLINLAVALKHTQPATFFIIKNGTLGGNPNFLEYSSTSCSAYDSSATTLTIADNSQIIFALPLSETSSANVNLLQNDSLGDLTLQPGEYITVACRTSSGSAAYATAVLNTREDQ